MPAPSLGGNLVRHTTRVMVPPGLRKTFVAACRTLPLPLTINISSTSTVHTRCALAATKGDNSLRNLRCVAALTVGSPTEVGRISFSFVACHTMLEPKVRSYPNRVP